MHEIFWPEGYIPGFTDNYVSNEVIVAGLGAAEVWPYLNTATAWPLYYANASDIVFHNAPGPKLSLSLRFSFKTFGFLVEGEVVEHVAPVAGRPGRVAWHGWVEGVADARLDVHHAWLIEDLSGGRVRLLTQETQNGQPARELAIANPNPMINGHQDWLNGLIKSAREKLKI